MLGAIICVYIEKSISNEKQKINKEGKLKWNWKSTHLIQFSWKLLGIYDTNRPLSIEHFGVCVCYDCAIGYVVRVSHMKYLWILKKKNFCRIFCCYLTSIRPLTLSHKLAITFRYEFASSFCGAHICLCVLLVCFNNFSKFFSLFSSCGCFSMYDRCDCVLFFAY